MPVVSPGLWHISQLSKAMPLDSTVLAAGFHKEIPPKRSATHLSTVLDELGAMAASGETGLANVLHDTAERVPQRALIVILSDLFIEPEVVRNCLEHLRFRKHDVAVFLLLEQSELELKFDRPMRFVDLEGGEPILADSNYHRGSVQTRPRSVYRKYERSYSRYRSGLPPLSALMRTTTMS